jgi:2'-5' RNA ligase
LTQPLGHTVSEKKADKQRYWITYLLKNLEEGANFSPDLLHLTIIPWFVTAESTSLVSASFRRKFSGIKAFKVRVEGSIDFKNSRIIPVNLIAHNPEIYSLHQQTLNWFDSMQARWAVKNPYVDKDYIPHIRRRPGHNLSDGDEIEINSLYLVKASRRGDDLRTVAAKVNLDA